MRSALVDLLRHDQYVQVPDVIDRAALTEITKRTRSMLGRYASRHQADIPPGIPYSVAQRMACMTMIDDPDDLQFPVIRAIRESRVWPVITGYLKTRSILCLIPISSVRVVAPTEPGVALPFHQDGFGLPEDAAYDMVSVWLLLDPAMCGPAAPTMEFIPGAPRRTFPLEPNPSNPLFKYSQAANADIAALDGRRTMLTIKQGDAVVFTRYAPHRTVIAPHHDTPRYSAEVRFLASNPQTVELFRQRDNPVMMFEPRRTLAPASIDWAASGKSAIPMRALPWPKRGSWLNSWL